MRPRCRPSAISTAKAAPTITSSTWEYDKTITPNTALILNDGWNIARAPSAKTQSGFQNLFLTLKYQVYVNAEHEFITSIGVVREFGGTGRVSAGADRYGSTAPTIYVGKGFGDLPIGPLRALGVTGELSYSVADIGLKGTTTTDPDTGAMSTSFNQGSGNALFGAVSLQYSLEYLRGQVKDYGFPDFINRLVPLVELTWTSSTNPPGAGPTQFVIAPGVIYAADTWDVGVEALVPGNKASGPNAGVIAQIHLYLDDLFPNTIGKPIFK